MPEQDGREYWFRSEEEVLNDLKKGEYLEAEIIHNQQVSGISIRELTNAQAEHKIAITDADLEGVHNIVKTKNDVIAIMLLPPSFEEWQRRIARRGKMTVEEERRRLETAKRILEDGLVQNYYHFVIADDIKRAALTIDAVAHGQLNPQHGKAEQLIRHLQYDLSQKLETRHI
jgi:guanylate kinase